MMTHPDGNFVGDLHQFLAEVMNLRYDTFSLKYSFMLSMRILNTLLSEVCIFW
jgi:hypothetical protein